MKTGFSLLLCFLFVANVSAQSWPTFRNDNARSGATQTPVDAAKLELAWHWQAQLPPDPAWDGPARWDAYNQIRDLPAMRQYDACFHPVSDGESVYFGSSSQDTLFALDLQTGKRRWAFVAGGPIRLAPTVDQDRILFGCDDGNVYCLDRTTGGLNWTFNPSASQSAEQRRLINNDRLISYFPIRTGVTVRDGLAYFGASFLPWRESYICAVDVVTGKQSSTKNTFVVAHSDATLEGSLLVAENRLIVPQGRVAPLLFSRDTGESLGSLPGGGGVTIVLTETGDVIRTEGGGPARAGQIGVFQGKERVATFPRGRSLVVDEKHFFVIDKQNLFAAERGTNALNWTLEIDEPLELIKVGGTVFVGGRDHVSAVDAASGRLVWSASTEGRVFGLAFAGDRLIASTDTGNIYAYAATAKNDWSSQSIVSDDQPNWKSPGVVPVREKNLVHRWVFHRTAMESENGAPIDGLQLDKISVTDQAGKVDLPLSGTAQAIRIGESESLEAIELNGAHFPLTQAMASQLPASEMSVESWVRIDESAQWGGIVGDLQDDGTTEHGWLLGYRSDKFCFAVATEGKSLTYLAATESFEPGTWNHVVGTYNGREMRLYVNGSLAATSTDQVGPVSYAGQPYFTVGAYRDQNEFYPLQGAIQEVRIYSSPLAATLIANQFAARRGEFEVQTHEDEFLSWGPTIRYDRPGEAVISYGTQSKMASVVDLINDHAVQRISSAELKLDHQVVIDQLPFRRELQFQIRDGDAEDSLASASFGLDTHFDWTPRGPTTTPEDSSDNQWVRDLIAASPNPRGLALVLGAEMATQAIDLAASSDFSVVLVVADEARAAEIRQAWQSNERIEYGSDLSVVTSPMQQLPAASAAVVIASKDTDAARRVVRPEGGVLHNGTTVAWKRESVKGSGVWSHMYGQADNSAFGGEHLADASDRQDLVTQWIGRPGPRYQTDRQNRKPSPLAIGGRMFLQGQQRMIALDSFSGSVLWSLETPTVMRWNVPHDCSNWCADESGVYVAAENQAWFLDGRTGEVARKFSLPIPEKNRAETSWGFIARHDTRLIGTTVKSPAIYTKWWGKSQWFDSTGGDDTHVVAADLMFSLDHQSGELQWRYPGLILHPTITIMGEHVYFIEDKTPAHKTSSDRRISLDAGQQHELVCIEIANGKKVWSKPISPFAGHLASLYLAGGGDADHQRLVLVASESTKKQFAISAWDHQTGGQFWEKFVDWEATHHGKHISRPAIQGELLYVRPEVINLADGATIHRGFPGGHGCSSYTLSTNGLFSRLGETTWWDVRHDKVNRFKRIRTDCWISVVPAQGMLLSAEGGGGCSCGTWLETSLGLLPRSVDQSFPGK